jgi:hypothetical protein
MTVVDFCDRLLLWSAHTSVRFVTLLALPLYQTNTLRVSVQEVELLVANNCN